jgi:hypothetical protein
MLEETFLLKTAFSLSPFAAFVAVSVPLEGTLVVGKEAFAIHTE